MYARGWFVMYFNYTIITKISHKKKSSSRLKSTISELGYDPRGFLRRFSFMLSYLLNTL